MFFFIFISILSGASIVLARILNSKLAELIGIMQGTFFNYVTGLFLSFIFLLFSNESLLAINLHPIPIWAYLGGVTGILVITLSSYITPKISAFYLTLIIFIGQIFTGIIIDYFTLNNLSIGKILGGLLVLAGLIFNLIVDKTSKPKLLIKTSA
ncbi:DMT family transporter [Clostridium akagii]|uniref:DMT family transporter n=1 Tax=Clostridium akagii TaxID=91623 RepID=UPI0005601F2A|nr:DMT family transporter [Clostridium akagii]